MLKALALGAAISHASTELNLQHQTEAMAGIFSQREVPTRHIPPQEIPKELQVAVGDIRQKIGSDTIDIPEPRETGRIPDVSNLALVLLRNYGRRSSRLKRSNAKPPTGEIQTPIGTFHMPNYRFYKRKR